MLINELRSREFSRLDTADHAYLDYTGAALYPASLIEGHAAMLRGAILGNPHSESPASFASSALLAEARAAVRRFFHAEDYEVCFTANASGALRLVGESYPFGPRDALVLSSDNHNSVNGIREYASRAGATVCYLQLDEEMRLPIKEIPRGRGLFAFPAQSNFSGVRHPLSLVHSAQASGYKVLLDAAAFTATSVLNLRLVKPEFVAISFYKMFGYPTGVGALLARRSALDALVRPWFAGGTVEHVTVGSRTHLLRTGAEGFEDGTVSFAALGAVTAGLRWLEDVGVEQIGKHAGELAQRLDAALGELRHRNSSAMVARYGPRAWVARGATVAFNVLDERGGIVSYEQVEASAREARVSVRGGCFCNPGAAESAGVGFGSDALGAVRASLGVSNDGGDVERLVNVVAEAATQRPRTRVTLSAAAGTRAARGRSRAESSNALPVTGKGAA